MSQLNFGPIKILSASSVDANKRDIKTSDCVEKFKLRKSETDHIWTLEPFFVFVEVSRPEGAGKTYENVSFTVACPVLSFAETYETKLEIYEGSNSGTIAEIVSVWGEPASAPKEGSLIVNIKCGSSALPEKTVPVLVA